MSDQETSAWNEDGAGGAETVQRYIDTQYERPWRKGN